MLGYIPKLLKKLQHVTPTIPQYSLNPSPHITYSAKVQFTKGEDKLPLLDNKGIKLIQSIVRVALYISCILEMTILVICSDLYIQ